jgi:uncharacterized protein (DUF2235 family)
MKRLFVCCDGTWNAPTDLHDGVPVPTNVCKFYNALTERDASNPAVPVEQLRYYHPGVGTNESWLRRIWDGAVGNGLARNVQSAYKWLADHYVERDQIFIIGFSRGAFTARSVAGFINRCGLPNAPSWDLVDEAFALYRLDPHATATIDALARFKVAHPSPTKLEIHFVGVWDTVGALGIPRTFDPLGIDWHNNRFHDQTLCPLVRHAYQALAIDEIRSDFSPTLWIGPSALGQVVEQVWFAGVHADVGGGYQEDALSDQTLRWMVERASECGAAFHFDMLAQLAPDVDGVLHDSYAGVFRVTGSQPRSFPNLAAATQITPTGQQVHSSVVIRRARPPITQAPYRVSTSLQPGESATVEIYAREQWNWTGMFLEEGATYHFSAIGQWQDGGRAIGPDGDNGNPVQWLFAMLKRVRTAKWFCLIGSIGDASNPTVAGEPSAMTTFPMGRTATISVARQGYLYCYANDAWRFYFNNRGSLMLTVTRVAA